MKWPAIAVRASWTTSCALNEDISSVSSAEHIRDEYSKMKNNNQYCHSGGYPEKGPKDPLTEGDIHEKTH